jgi:ElaB/YqjD/DUF883 family membrane-anchored ribosome-binding protein
MNTNTNASLADTAPAAIERARNALGNMADDARALTDRGAQAVREGTRSLRRESAHLAESTVDHIKHDPIKSILIAAAAGAVLMALANLATRSYRSRY